MNYSKLLLILFLVCISYVSCEYRMCDDVKIKIFGVTPDIEIHSGKVRGKVVNTVFAHRLYSSFKGIRYAKPPINGARFLPPFGVDPWEGVVDAFEHGPECPQMDGILHGKFIGNEDCLFINVYTPVIYFDFNTNKSLEHPKKAVLLWIHGGAFYFGSGNSELYGPDFIVEKDVILVTFNYRLGAPGFLNLNDPRVPGNAGLKDQNLAMQWVKRNIDKFGGDKERITIFGQSAGGASIDFHLISDLSKGLFRRSISLSGSAFCGWAFSTSYLKKVGELAFGLSFVKVNNNKRLANQFMSVDIEELTEQTLALFDAENLELPFTPTIEIINGSYSKCIIDECYEDKFSKGQIFPGEHILGYTNAETNVGGRKLEEIYDSIFSEELLEFKTDLLYAFNSITRNPLIDKSSFDLFEKPIDAKQQIMVKSANASNVYYYHFNYEEEDRNVMRGAAHSDDLRYIFFRRNTDQICKPYLKHRDVKMRDQLTSMLTNFAKYGDPSLKDVKWIPSNKDGNYLEISKKGKFRMRSGRPIQKNWVLKYNEIIDVTNFPKIFRISCNFFNTHLESIVTHAIDDITSFSLLSPLKSLLIEVFMDISELFFTVAACFINYFQN